MIRTSIALLTFMGSAGALELNVNKVLDVSVSGKGLTRISVEGDQIVDVFVYPAGVTDNLQLHKSGHVFVVSEGLKQPLYVTLITRKGITQDIKLTTQDRPASPIILKAGSTLPEINPEEDVSTILSTFVQGNPSQEFSNAPLPEFERTVAGFDIHGEGAWWGKKYIITRFEIINTSEETVRLRGEQVASPQDLAVAFTKNTLSPGEKSHFYVLQKKTYKPRINPRKEKSNDE